MFKSAKKSCAVLMGLILVVLCLWRSFGSDAELAGAQIDDLLGYATTSGTDNYDAAFQKTILAQFCTDPAVKAFVAPIAEQMFGEIRKGFDEGVGAEPGQ